MVEEGQYIYCIIETKSLHNFGPIGIGNRGDPVTTISYEELSAVVSSTPISKCVASKETMLAHEQVIETVMRCYTLLPVRFCTVAPNAEDIRNLLRRRYSEFKKLLRELDNKVELGLKVLWKDMDAILNEILSSEKGISKVEVRVTTSFNERRDLETQVGIDPVKSALQEKNITEREILLQPLRQISSDCRLNNTYGDDMIVNAAFLIDRALEREFDNRVEQLISDYGERIEFKYVGPVPPYSFVNIIVTD